MKLEGSQSTRPLSFALTGILAIISGTLAQAGISIFAVSTYNTDYILVKQDRLQDAIDALTERENSYNRTTSGV